MSEPVGSEGEAYEETVAPLFNTSALREARGYWANANKIGQPGGPNMVEGSDLQRQHAEMARTAALLSIAESLSQISHTLRANHGRLIRAASSLDTLAKETTKMRYLARKGV